MGGLLTLWSERDKLLDVCSVVPESEHPRRFSETSPARFLKCFVLLTSGCCKLCC